MTHAQRPTIPPRRPSAPPSAKFCGGCGHQFGQEECRATTSQGDRCIGCAPSVFNVIDGGEEIGLREVWSNGAVVRRVFGAVKTA